MHITYEDMYPLLFALVLLHPAGTLGEGFEFPGHSVFCNQFICKRLGLSLAAFDLPMDIISNSCYADGEGCGKGGLLFGRLSLALDVPQLALSRNNPTMGVCWIG